MALGTMALIGMLTSLAGTVASGVGSAVKNNQMDRRLRNSMASSETEANREIYTNPLARKDNAAYLRNMREQLKAQRETDLARGKILGSTEEQNTANQGAYANAYSKAISNLSTINSSRRDNILNRLHNDRLNNEQMVNNLALQRMQNWANLAANAAEFGGSMMGSKNDIDLSALKKNNDEEDKDKEKDKNSGGAVEHRQPLSVKDFNKYNSMYFNDPQIEF